MNDKTRLQNYLSIGTSDFLYVPGRIMGGPPATDESSMPLPFC